MTAPKVRTASGRFASAPPETTTAKRSAGERLQLVKLGIKALERERDEITAEWRRSLLADDLSTVKRCERQLDVLDWKLRRSQALIDLLPPLIAREQQQQRKSEWPSSRPDAEAALAGTQAELERCETILPVDRSAHHQQRIDHLRARSYALLRLLESMQPKDMVAR